MTPVQQRNKRSFPVDIEGPDALGGHDFVTGHGQVVTGKLTEFDGNFANSLHGITLIEDAPTAAEGGNFFHGKRTLFVQTQAGGLYITDDELVSWSHKLTRAACAPAGLALPWAAGAPDRKAIQFFETRTQSVLAEDCCQCHGGTVMRRGNFG